MTNKASLSLCLSHYYCSISNKLDNQEGTERERKSWFAAVDWCQNTTRRNVKDT